MKIIAIVSLVIAVVCMVYSYTTVSKSKKSEFNMDQKVEKVTLATYKHPVLVETPKDSIWEFTHALQNNGTESVEIGYICANPEKTDEFLYNPSYSIRILRKESLLGYEDIYSISVKNIMHMSDGVMMGSQVKVTSENIDKVYESISTAIDEYNTYSEKVNAGEVKPDNNTNLGIFISKQFQTFTA